MVESLPVGYQEPEEKIRHIRQVVMEEAIEMGFSPEGAEEQAQKFLEPVIVKYSLPEQPFRG